MKIYASGDAQAFNHNEEGKYLSDVRVVGVFDLGANNGDNIFGWSGTKAVVNHEDKLWILDYTEQAKITTNDGLLIDKGYEIGSVWYPSTEKASIYDLYVYPEVYRWLSGDNRVLMTDVNEHLIR